jgi:Uma2 family endonuclease
MTSDSLAHVTHRPTVDYAHLPGEEQNPLMESTLHVDWGLVLLNSARHTLANTNHLVTGNVAFAPNDGQPHTAPDVMVIPNAAGREFGRYEPGPGEPLPSVCVEILSPSNTRADISRRCDRLLRLGVPEVYVLDPTRDTIVRVERDDADGLVEQSAIGQSSVGLALTFATVDGHLAVCCPAGRVVRPGDDPFGWLVDEQRRADSAEAEADRAKAEADRAKAEADRAKAETSNAIAEAEALRLQVAALQDELDRLRPS